MTTVRIGDEGRVDASPLEVWEAIKDPARHAQWHPFVTEISGEHELGRVRTSTVIVGKKTGETKERCIEEEHASRITWTVEEDSTGFGRMVSGWRAGFALRQHDRATVVSAYSTFEPRNMLVRAMIPIIRRKFHQTQRPILVGLKESLEAQRDKIGPGVDLGKSHS
jgi:uncharacterized protein YndB with AHSA1/START domain